MGANRMDTWRRIESVASRGVTPTIPDLGLIESCMKTRIGVGPTMNRVKPRVAEFFGGIDVRRVTHGSTIGVHDAVADFGHPSKTVGCYAPHNDGAGDQPLAFLAGSLTPATQVLAVQQGFHRSQQTTADRRGRFHRSTEKVRRRYQQHKSCGQSHGRGHTNQKMSHVYYSFCVAEIDGNRPLLARKADGGWIVIDPKPSAKAVTDRQVTLRDGPVSARENHGVFGQAVLLTPEGDLKVLLDEGDPHKVDRLEQAFFNNHVTEDVLFVTGRASPPEWPASPLEGRASKPCTSVP